MSDKTNIKEVVRKEKKKDLEQISKENEALMSAFGEQLEQEQTVDVDKLAELKAKLAEKRGKEQNSEEDVEMPDLISKREVSINMGFIGVGQAGSRIAEEFHVLGYDVGIINTSAQDLDSIGVLPHQKLLLDGSLGGTGKSRELSLDISQSHEEAIRGFMEDVADGVDMITIVSSGGGGTGSGSCAYLAELATGFGKPVGVIYVLPKQTEGAKNKVNSLECLSELSALAAESVIDSLIIADNARLEVLLSNVGHGKFWSMSNKMITGPLDRLNKLTYQPTSDALDPSDFGNILTTGGITIYGTLRVEDYMDETALAEAVINSLGDNMLSEGFDLTQAISGGLVFVGPSDAIDNIPSINLDYCQHMISEATNGANLYRGIYIDDNMSDCIEVISIFSGLGLPKDRVDELKKEVVILEQEAKRKEGGRVANMSLDLQKNRTSNAREDIHKKIRRKNSGFSKLQSGGTARKSIINKRRKR